MGIPTLISTATATNAASIDITSGIDSTYDEYMFVMTNINPATDNAVLQCQFNAAGGSGFNETMTTTQFRAYHTESGATTAFNYRDADDQAQGTSKQSLSNEYSNATDSGGGGTLHLFSPSNTTYVKHFYSTVSFDNNAVHIVCYTAGYINTTAAIDEIQFIFSAGNLDGVIQMYGIA